MRAVALVKLNIFMSREICAAKEALIAKSSEARFDMESFGLGPTVDHRMCLTCDKV